MSAPTVYVGADFLDRNFFVGIVYLEKRKDFDMENSANVPITPEERLHLEQVVEMFAVIVESIPNDFQSLEILLNAYEKLELKEKELALRKKFIKAYSLMGQLNTALTECEFAIGKFPDDTELREIEKKISGFLGGK